MAAEPQNELNDELVDYEEEEVPEGDAAKGDQVGLMLMQEHRNEICKIQEKQMLLKLIRLILVGSSDSVAARYRVTLLMHITIFWTAGEKGVRGNPLIRFQRFPVEAGAFTSDPGLWFRASI